MRKLALLIVSVLIFAACGSEVTVVTTGVDADAEWLKGENAYKLNCRTLTINAGSIGSGQRARALSRQELSGTQDVWDDYVEFSPLTEAVCTFRLPSYVEPASLASVTINTNYCGPTKEDMLWSFDVLDATASWVNVGDNGFAADWVWSTASLAVPAPFASIFADGVMKVRFRTTSAFDAAELDQWVVKAALGTPPPAPTCVPACTGVLCGDSDGCGGSCRAGSGCSEVCVSACAGVTCGQGDSCGGTCQIGSGCTTPTCVPACAGVTCGQGDSCGGTCQTGSGCTASTSTSSGIWRPAPDTSWQWQLTGTIDTSLAVAMYDIDLFDSPQSVIDTLHAQGKKVICYFSAGSYENWRPDSASFPAAVLGSSNGWPGEKWLDIRNAALQPVMIARLDLAVSKKCDGVEPDNVDGYTNSTGFPLTASNQLAYNRFLAAAAHARNLSVALKNDVDQAGDLVGDFDFAVNEECFKYNECSTLTPFINAHKAVFQVEYGSASLSTSVCPKANAANFDTLIKTLDLDAWRVACR